MGQNYSYLTEELRPVADIVYAHLKNDWGLKSIQVESVDFEATPAPTFCGNRSRGLKICVEINYSLYPQSLNEFVADCIQLGLPVKLYVAVPVIDGKTIKMQDITRAVRFGVGCLLIEGKRITTIRDALDLSLLLNEDEKEKSKFPQKLRLEINNAISTYENGDPKKGVSNIFDIIESIIRKIAIQAKSSNRIPSSNTLDLKRDAWVGVMKVMLRHNVLDDIFLSRCIGSSTTRNYSSHPPKSFIERQRMHKRLRTNYNLSIDLLKDLIEEAKNKNFKI